MGSVCLLLAVLLVGCSADTSAPTSPPSPSAPALPTSPVSPTVGEQTSSQEDDGAVSSLESVGTVDRSDVEVRVAEILDDLEAVPEPEGAVVEIPDTVLFDFDSAQLEPGASEVLDGVAEVLVLLEDAPAEVRGHTDAVGDDAYNQQLSEDRAAAVVTYLVEAGVDRAVLSSEGLGESEPVADNDSESGRARNRRVEVVLPSVDLDALPDPG